MALSRMQGIGGCRSIVPSVADLRAIQQPLFALMSGVAWAALNFQ